MDADQHMALGSGSQIAAGTQARLAAADASATPAPQQSELPVISPDIAAVFREAGIPDDVLPGALRWAAEGTPNKTDSELEQMDKEDLASTVAALEHIWGTDFKRNLDSVRHYISNIPETAAALIQARDPETGHNYLNDPANVVRLAGLARAPQPTAYTIEGVEAFMRTNRGAYSKDEALQARYREMLAAREAQKGN